MTRASRAIAHLKKPLITKKAKNQAKTVPKSKVAAKGPKTVEQKRRTIVLGHRGGNFGPDNSMKNFRGSVKHKLEGIEFDVSQFTHVGTILTVYL